VTADLKQPEIRSAVRQGMLESLVALEDAATASVGLFFRGHGTPRRAQTGHAADSVRSKLFEGPPGFLGVTGWPAPDFFYLHILEHGAKSHEIKSTEFVGRGRRRRRVKDRKRLKIGTGGNPLFRWAVTHPGLRPRPFMATAGRTAEPRIVTIMNERIGDAIEAVNG
jgi:hypothetical protein